MCSNYGQQMPYYRTKIADKQADSNEKLTTYTDPNGKVYQLREHVYIEMGKENNPYGIALIHSFKERKGEMYMDIRWYYRYSDLPPEVIESDDFKQEEDGSCDECPAVIDVNKIVDTKPQSTTNNISFIGGDIHHNHHNQHHNNKLKRIKSRELFASEVLDSCLASHITGRCCIVSYHNLKEAQEFIPYPDTFYYFLTYNPHLKRVASTQGEIRVGPEYQAVIPDGPADSEKTSRAQSKQRRKPLKSVRFSAEESLWHVERANNLNQNDLMTYIQAVRSIASFSTMYDQFNNGDSSGVDSTLYNTIPCQKDFIIQCAYDTLHEADYDFTRALEIMSKCSLTPPIKETWTDDDQKKFQRGIRHLNKNFYRIQKDFLPDKSVSEVIEFYYLWKKTNCGISMRPKRRLKPMLQRRIKTPTNTEHDGKSIQSENTNDTNEKTEFNDDFVQCQHCKCRVEGSLSLLNISEKEEIHCCSGCLQHFRKYEELPLNTIDIPKEKALTEGRLHDAMTTFALRDRVRKSPSKPKSDLLVEDVVLVDKERFSLIMHVRKDGYSCSRSQVEYVKKFVPDQKRRSKSSINKRNIDDNSKLSKNSEQSIDKKIKVESHDNRKDQTKPIQSNSSNAFNAPTLNKIFNQGWNPLMTPIDNDTPSLRQLRDLANMRSGNANFMMHPNIHNTNNQQSLALHHFMAALNNQQPQPPSQQQMLALQRDALLQQQLNGRRPSPAVKTDSQLQQSHNHAHLHSHSHTHLHLNDANSSNNQPPIPHNILPPHQTHHYQQLLNHLNQLPHNDETSHQAPIAHQPMDLLQSLTYNQSNSPGLHHIPAYPNPFSLFLPQQAANLHHHQMNIPASINQQQQQLHPSVLTALANQHQLMSMLMLRNMSANEQQHHHQMAIHQQLMLQQRKEDIIKQSTNRIPSVNSQSNSSSSSSNQDNRMTNKNQEE